MKKIFDDICDALGRFLTPEPEKKTPDSTADSGQAPSAVPASEPATPAPPSSPAEPAAAPNPEPAPITEPFTEPVSEADPAPAPAATDNVELPELPELPEPPHSLTASAPIPSPAPVPPAQTGPQTDLQPVAPPDPIEINTPSPAIPDEPKHRKEQPIDMRPAKVQNVENADAIVNLIIAQLGDAPKLEELTLTVLSDMDLVLARLSSQAFKEQIMVTMSQNFGNVFGAVAAMSYDPEKHSGAVAIAPHVWATVQTELIEEDAPAPAPVIASFTLSVVPGFGSLIGSPLTFAEAGTYNIGRGNPIQLRNGSIRRNQIAFSNDASDPQAGNNAYVARDHAHILFKPESGVYLFPELSGTSLAGRRTKIFRGNDEIRVENTQMAVRLLDGDQIELSKHVLINITITPAN